MLQLASSLALPPPDDGFVRARSATALSSAAAQTGHDAEAIVSRPLFDEDRPNRPARASLKRSLVQGEPASPIRIDNTVSFFMIWFFRMDSIRRWT